MTAINSFLQCLALKCETEKELRRQLKLQSEAFADHLGDALKVREQELEREFTRKLDEQLEAEKCKFKMQMAAIMGRLQGLDKALKGESQTHRIFRGSVAKVEKNLERILILMAYGQFLVNIDLGLEISKLSANPQE